jgi:hypothetical protein
MELEETVQVVQGRNKFFLIKSLIIEEDKRASPPIASETPPSLEMALELEETVQVIQ